MRKEEYKFERIEDIIAHYNPKVGGEFVSYIIEVCENTFKVRSDATPEETAKQYLDKIATKLEKIYQEYCGGCDE